MSIPSPLPGATRRSQVVDLCARVDDLDLDDEIGGEEYRHVGVNEGTLV
jgi:hypothetical protein